MVTDRPSLWGLLAETTAVQAVGTMAVLTIPAIAPKVAQSVGIPAGQIGYQVSLLYLAAMLSSLVAGTWVVRLGPCRASQIAMGLTGAGCGLASMAHVFLLLLGSLVIGTAYGLINPASSDLLMRHVPAARRNLFFSIKQTGVPLGGMLIGVIAPSLALAFDWNAPLLLVATAAVLLALGSQPMRATWDAHRDPFRRLSGLSFAGFQTVASNPALLRLAVASFFFSAVQLSLVAFLVVLLVEEVRLGLVVAGMILAAVQIAGAVGRIGWGMFADQVGNGLDVLLLLSLVMAAAAAAVMGISPAWPLPAVILVFMALGVTAVGWNGVYLSEIARLSPGRSIGSTTGAAMFLTFMGVVAGPPLFSALHGFLKSYASSYALLVAFALIGALLVASIDRRQQRLPLAP